MLDGKTIAVVVPCYNEETQIGMVIETMPDFVDRIIIIDDCSTDGTGRVVRDYMEAAVTSTLHLPKNHDKLKANHYNRASLVAQEIRNNEVSRYTPARVVNLQEESDRIILI